MNANPYQDGAGDLLVQVSNYPEEINDYLQKEEGLLKSMLPFSHLIEVGCMHGRYLDWCLLHDVHYTGIDIIERYIKDALRRIKKKGISNSQFCVIQQDAKYLHNLSIKKTGLLFFPFNSFGNMSDINGVISSLCKSASPFLICSYKTNSKSSCMREVYYNNCGFLSLEKYIDNKGVRFVERNGFNSIAYHEKFMINMFSCNNITLDVYDIGEYGIAYYGNKNN